MTACVRISARCTTLFIIHDPLFLPSCHITSHSFYEFDDPKQVASSWYTDIKISFLYFG